MKEKNKNVQKCSSLRSDIERLNNSIQGLEKEIDSKKLKMKDLKNQKTILTNKMKNLMVKYGVSIDFIADAFVPNPYAAIIKSFGDKIGAPQPRDIEKIMDQISLLEKENKNTENLIMSLGIDVRKLHMKKEDFVKEMRHLGCNRKF